MRIHQILIAHLSREEHVRTGVTVAAPLILSAASRTVLYEAAIVPEVH
jgi:hypothetical protein